MTQDEWVEALRRTLDDHRMSRGEKQALRALVEEHRPDLHARQLARAAAFRVAREAQDEAGAAAVLEWLEDVVRVLDVEPSVAQALPEVEAWFSPGEEPLACVVRELRRARAKIDICVFTITDDRISDGILSAARRGVSVRLISDNEKAGDLGSDLGRFERAGVPVAFDRSSAHMHHKFAVFDATRLLTGSFNWTRAATGENHENVLVTEDPRLVRAYADEFERLWRDFTSV